MKRNKIALIVLGAMLAVQTNNINMKAVPTSEKQQQLKNVQTSISEMQVQVQQLDNEIIVAGNDIEKNEATIRDLKEKISKAEDDLIVANQKLDKSKKAMNDRVSDTYKNGDKSFLSIVFTSKSVSDAVIKLDAYAKLNEMDKQLVDDYNKQIDSISKLEASLKSDEEEAETLKKENIAKQNDMESKKDEVNALLDDAKKKESDLKAQIAAELAAQRAAEEAARRAAKAAADAAAKAAAEKAQQEAAQRAAELRAQQEALENQEAQEAQAAAAAAQIAAAAAQEAEAQAAAAYIETSNNSSQENYTQDASNVASTPIPEPAIVPEPVIAPEPVVAPSSNGNGIIATAKQYLGTPYVWGGATPSGFDCSGFVQYVFAQNGIYLGRTTYDQVLQGRQVSLSNLQPGDLVFFGAASAPYHVGIYVGGNQYIHAPQTGDVIKISTLSNCSVAVRVN